MAGSGGYERTQLFNGSDENDTNTYIHLVLTYSQKLGNKITLYRNGIIYGTPYNVSKLSCFIKYTNKILLGRSLGWENANSYAFANFNIKMGKKNGFIYFFVCVCVFYLLTLFSLLTTIA